MESTAVVAASAFGNLAQRAIAGMDGLPGRRSPLPPCQVHPPKRHHAPLLAHQCVDLKLARLFTAKRPLNIPGCGFHGAAALLFCGLY